MSRTQSNSPSILSESETSWEWTDCTTPLKRSSVLNSTPLLPHITTHNANDNQQPVLEIEMNRLFDFDSRNGWNWHKSWILPSFSVTFESKIVNDQYQYEKNHNNFYVEILVVTETSERSGEKYLNEVNIIGKNKFLFKNSKNHNVFETKFNALKFGSTTYNNNKKKFRLLVIVYAEDNSEIKIQASKISPLIYVDSRKSARETMPKEDFSLKLYDPDLNEKQFFKKKRMENSQNEPEKISSNLEGLISYYTAPNIRNKIKHPFFLGIRFQESVSLYLNQNLFPNEDKQNATYKLLELLHNYNGQSLSNEKNGTNQLVLIIFIKSAMKINFIDKTILKLIGKINEDLIKFVFDESLIPSNFVELPPIKSVLEIYKQAFNNLMDHSIEDLVKKKKVKIADESEPVFFPQTSKIEPMIAEPLIPQTMTNNNQMTSENFNLPNFPQMNINSHENMNNFLASFSSISSYLNLKSMMSNYQLLMNMNFGYQNPIVPNFNNGMISDIWNQNANKTLLENSWKNLLCKNSETEKKQ